MSYFLNEHSLQGQYVTSYEFEQALTTIARLRQKIKDAGYEFYCCPSILSCNTMNDVSFERAISELKRDLKQLVRTWLSASPNWLDAPYHDAIYDEYWCSGELVNHGSLAEAACRTHLGYFSEVISFANSVTHNDTPIRVTWETPASDPLEIEINNYWTHEQVVAALEQRVMNAERLPVTSWKGLVEWGHAFCPYLFLADNLLHFLEGVPFSSAAAKRVQERLKVLNDLRAETNADGTRTEAGHKIYQREFIGARANFTDESETNKHLFRADLTFRHPEMPDVTLFCPWHGKVSTQIFRIHFSWPITSESHLYIVYIGPKITKE
jgi:hypothetical protein